LPKTLTLKVPKE